MYLLFRYKQWKPSDYFDMHESDKRLARVFIKRELEDIKKELQGLEGKA